MKVYTNCLAGSVCSFRLNLTCQDWKLMRFSLEVIRFIMFSYCGVPETESPSLNSHRCVAAQGDGVCL